MPLSHKSDIQKNLPVRSWKINDIIMGSASGLCSSYKTLLSIYFQTMQLINMFVLYYFVHVSYRLIKIASYDLPLILFIPNRLVYNQSSGKMGNTPGVEVQVPYFGTTRGVSYLDPSLYHPGEYFADMVSALESIGLKDGLSIRAAPFDFRYAPGK